jgi:hypothetical protein
MISGSNLNQKFGEPEAFSGVPQHINDNANANNNNSNNNNK